MVHAFLTGVSPVRYWEEPLRPPAPGCMNSPFGASRLHNGKPTGDYHGGVDQHGAAGSPIRAVAAGTVRIVRLFTLRGGTIAIDHGQGLETIYMHMSRFAAKEGQQVKAGDVIMEINHKDVRNSEDAVRLTSHPKNRVTLLRLWSSNGNNSGIHYLVVDESKTS